jgi:hypothetical protein
MHLSTGHRALQAFVEADALEEEVTYGESLSLGHVGRDHGFVEMGDEV